jgi:hypothetical protein
MKNALNTSFRDLRESFARLPLAFFLAWQDIRLRYSRSLIGPFWVSISILVTAAAGFEDRDVFFPRHGLCPCLGQARTSP